MMFNWSFLIIVCSSMYQLLPNLPLNSSIIYALLTIFQLHWPWSSWNHTSNLLPNNKSTPKSDLTVSICYITVCWSETWGDFPRWLWSENSNDGVAPWGCTDFTSKAWLGLEDPLVELLAANLSVSHWLLLFKIHFIYLFWAVLGLCCCVGFSLHSESGGYSLVVVCRLVFLWWLLFLGSTGSRSHRLQELWHMSSVVAALWL